MTELKTELQRWKRNYDTLEHMSKDKDEVILTDGPVQKESLPDKSEEILMLEDLDKFNKERIAKLES